MQLKTSKCNSLNYVTDFLHNIFILWLVYSVGSWQLQSQLHSCLITEGHSNQRAEFINIS